MNTFTVDTKEYPLLKVQDAKIFKNRVISFYAAHKSYICIFPDLAHLTGVFKNHVNLPLCIIGPDEKDIKLYLLRRLHLQRANKLPKLNQSTYSRDSPGR